MLYNTQEMMLRRKLEQQAELQQAIELQGRRLINLQLPDLRGDYIHHHQRSMSAGASVTLPPHASANINRTLTSDVKNQDVIEGWLINGSCLILAWHLEHAVDRKSLLWLIGFLLWQTRVIAQLLPLALLLLLLNKPFSMNLIKLVFRAKIPSMVRTDLILKNVVPMNGMEFYF